MVGGRADGLRSLRDRWTVSKDGRARVWILRGGEGVKVAWMLGLGLGDWVSVKVRFGWRIREVPCLQIQGEIYTHSELLRTSGVRRGVGVNESVKKGHPGSQGELGSKGTVSGRVKAVVGSILVAHDGNRGLRSLKRRHGVGCEERCESGP